MYLLLHQGIVILIFIFASAALSKSLNLFVPQFPQLQSENNNFIYLLEY